MQKGLITHAAMAAARSRTRAASLCFQPCIRLRDPLAGGSSPPVPTLSTAAGIRQRWPLVPPALRVHHRSDILQGGVMGRNKPQGVAGPPSACLGSLRWQSGDEVQAKKPKREKPTSHTQLQKLFKVLRWKRKMKKQREGRRKDVEQEDDPYWLENESRGILHSPGLGSSVLRCPLQMLTGFSNSSDIVSRVQDTTDKLLDTMSADRNREAFQRALVDCVDEEVKDLFGDSAYLTPYGSVVAGLGLKDSDIDLQLSLGTEWEEALERVRLKEMAVKRFEGGMPNHQQAIGAAWEEEGGLGGGGLLRWTEEGSEEVQENKKNILKGLSSRLRNFQMLEVRNVLKARVPVIKILPTPESGDVACDITVSRGGGLATYTAEYLKTLASIDSRVVQLVRAVKVWAKRRGVNNAYEGTLNSYALTLMCVYILQNVKPQIVPSLHETTLYHPHKHGEAQERARQKRLKKGKPSGPRSGDDARGTLFDMSKRMEDIEDEEGVFAMPATPLARLTGFDGQPLVINFHSNTKNLRGWGHRNQESTAHLLIRFFAFFSSIFDYKKECLSVRKVGQLLLKDSSLVIPKYRPERGYGFCMYIEDPIDPSNNVARSVDMEGLEKIRKELRRANMLLQEPERCHLLFQSLTAEKLLKEEQDEELEKEAEYNRIMRAKIRGMQAGHEIIERMGGYPDAITWDDVRNDPFNNRAQPRSADRSRR